MERLRSSARLAMANVATGKSENLILARLNRKCTNVESELNQDRSGESRREVLRVQRECWD